MDRIGLDARCHATESVGGFDRHQPTDHTHTLHAPHTQRMTTAAAAGEMLDHGSSASGPQPSSQPHDQPPQVRSEGDGEAAMPPLPAAAAAQKRKQLERGGGPPAPEEENGGHNPHHRQKKKKKKQQQQQQQRTQRPEFPLVEVEYSFQDGLRHVVPYVYAFTARAKGRWWGKPVLEVFQKEFRTYNPAYYEASLRAGTITVNGQKVDPGYLLQNNDLLLHKCHRHEPPVSGEQPLQIIAEDARAVVVLKPPTVPVHPCGAYRFNSVLHILQRERPDLFPPTNPSPPTTVQQQQPPPPASSGKPSSAGLHVIYRLDRLTSGLLILAKSPEEAARMCAELQSGRTKKSYLALVKGDFASQAAFPPMKEVEEGSGGAGRVGPEVLFDEWCVGVDDNGEEEEGGKTTARKQEKKEGKKGEERSGDGVDGAEAEAETETEEESQSAPMRWRVQADGSVDAQAGICCVSYRDAVYECSPRGKPSRTLFRPLGFDGENSLVACRPITGRTHQIRNHLRWLGYPIANDPNYGDAATVQAFKGQWGKQTEAYEYLPTSYAQNETLSSSDDTAQLSEEEQIRRLCPYCRHGEAVMFKGEQLHHNGIFLHAWRYQALPREGEEKGWAYEAPLPPWARGFQAGGDRGRTGV